MEKFIELLNNYTSSKGYEPVNEKGFYDFITEKKVNLHYFRVYVNYELFKKDLFRLSIIDKEINFIYESTHMRISEFLDFNNLLDVTIENMYNNMLHGAINISEE